MKKLKSQSGRSMVEMLGVLAIIGVLSVGGISGYSISMRKHRANGVVDLISKYAVDVYSHCQKQISDGTADYVGDCRGFPTFADAGVGALPAGVKSIEIDMVSDPRSDGIDYVKTQVRYTDQKLCQAVASLAGAICFSSNKEYITNINIKQN